MTKHLLVFILFLISFKPVLCQNDTAIVPYWIEMMQDEKVNFFQTQRAFDLYWQNRTIDKGSGWKAFKRWEYSTSLRTDEFGNIVPLANFYRAINQWDSAINNTKSKYSLGAPCYSNGYWKELGPIKYPANNTGQPTGMGRINALAFHPKIASIIYAGAPSGGLWVSKNYGKTWTSNTDSLPTLGVSSIAIMPNAPDTIFIGTGDRDASDASGLGVIWSTDGGNTWAARNTGMGALTVGALCIDPSNPNVIIAATNNGIYRSSNFGNSWSQRISGNFKELVFAYGSSNVVFASMNGGFYRSGDNGINWTKITNGLPTSGVSRGVIAVTPADTNYVYFLETSGSVFQGMYRSTDKGLTFTTRSTTPNIMDYSHLGTGGGGQAWYDLDVAADPVNKDIVYSAGVNIFRSTDGGTTWKINAHWVGTGAPSVHADHHALEYNPHDNSLFSGNDGGVYYKKHTDSIWINISAGLAVSQIYKLGQSATNKKVLINGYQDNGSARYNGNFTTVFGGDGMDCLVDFTDESISYGEIYYGSIFRVKNNNPENYVAGSGRNGITESGAWVTPFLLKSDNPNTMFAGYKNVWRSNNIKAAVISTITWTKISDNLGGSNSANINFLENNSTQPNMLFVARSDNKFFRTSNASATTPTWTDLTSTLPAGGAIYAVETHFKDSNLVYISQSNRIYKSSNRGLSWTNISANLPNVPFLSIVIDTSSTKGGMYVGGYAGVYYTDQTMSAWIPFSFGLPKTSRVQDLEIYYSPNSRAESHLVAATYGRGNWVTPLFDDDKKPIADFEISDTTVCTLTSLTFTNKSLNLASVFNWEINPGTISFINGTSSNGENAQIICNKTGPYTITLFAENCMGMDSITKLFKLEAFDTTRKPSCIPPANVYNNWGMGVTDFILNGKNHQSLYTKDEGEYLDFTCNTIFKLKPDTFYQVRLITNPTNNEYVRGFIDFNDNGILSDPGEMVIQTAMGKTHLDTIVVPNNVVMNKPLRMRIMSDYNNFSNPCAKLSYGQTQDYAVYFELPKLIAVSNYDSVCSFSEVNISDSSSNSFAYYDWDFGAFASPSKAIGKGPHTVKFSSAGYQKISLTINKLYNKLFDSLVFVKPTPNQAYTYYPKNGLCEGVMDSIVSKDTNNLKPKFSWYKDGKSISTTGSAIIWKSLILSDSGYYRSVLTLNGCTDTGVSVKLNVFAAPIAGFTVNDSTQCFRSNQLIIKDLSKVKIGTLFYNYSTGDGKNYTISQPNHKYTSAGSFIIKQFVNTKNGCRDSASLNATVFDQPVAKINAANVDFCFKSQAFDFTSNSSIATGIISKDYWQITGLNKDSGSNYKPYLNSFGKYSLSLISVSNNNCSDTATLPIAVFPNPVSNFTVNDTDQCLKNNNFLLANNSVISTGVISNVYWDLGDGTFSSSTGSLNKNYNSAGKYIVSLIAVSDKMCSDTFIGQVSLFPQPFLKHAINSDAQCLSNNLFKFYDSSSISNGSLTSFNWDLGDNTSHNTKNTAHTYLKSFSPVVVHWVESDKGCRDSITIPLTVHQNPIADFSYNNACVFDTIKFSDASSFVSNSISSSKWILDPLDKRITGNVAKVYNSPGIKTISLIVTDTKGCKDSIAKNITVYSKPKAAFSWITTPLGGSNTLLKLNDQSTGAINWQWTDGMFNQSSGTAVDFNYSDSATVRVLLTVTNVEGCMDTSHQIIRINPVVILHFPTAFSPNGDLLNDLLQPEGVERVANYRLVIFNRWGEVVFQTKRSNEYWDGNFMGREMPAGAYPYYIELIDLAGNKINKNGVVSLIR
jgi:gliding motility-associated-like protein